MSELTNVTHKARYYIRYKNGGEIINTICGECSCSKDNKDNDRYGFFSAEAAEKIRKTLRNWDNLEVCVSYGQRITSKGEIECQTEEDI